jgi:hypothetical protein
MLKGLNYDRNIVQFYGACIRQGCDPLLITEYMEGMGGAVVTLLRTASSGCSHAADAPPFLFASMHILLGPQKAAHAIHWCTQ